MELKKEKYNKQSCFSLSDDPNFNEIFENRDKLIHYLKTEFSDRKEKVIFYYILILLKNFKNNLLL